MKRRQLFKTLAAGLGAMLGALVLPVKGLTFSKKKGIVWQEVDATETCRIDSMSNDKEGFELGDGEFAMHIEPISEDASDLMRDGVFWISPGQLERSGFSVGDVVSVQRRTVYTMIDAGGEHRNLAPKRRDV